MQPALELLTDPIAEIAPIARFADAMSALAGGVVLVTCWVGDRPWGTTVTAFASVSADPPTVLVSLGTETVSARAITPAGRFGVSILAADQVAVARHGSVPGAAKFLDPLTETGHASNASPVVAGALAHLDCEVADVARVADHAVFFGLVRAARSSAGGAPLLYHRRDYRMLGPRATPCLEAEGSATCFVC